MNRNAFFLVVISVLFAGCATITKTPAVRFDETPRLAVISAFDAELEKLRGAATITATSTINGRNCYLGRLAGNDVVLLLSGVSMVNAAMTTQALLDRFNVRGIVFSGIAGGVNPSLRVGDVTIPARWGEYQEQVFARETPQGWDPGRFGGSFGNYGMMFPNGVQVTRKEGAPDETEQRFWFDAEAAMLRAAGRISGKVRLRRCTAEGECLPGEPRVVVGGNGVSGPTFVDNAAYRRWVWDTFRADALDMETAAVAHVAYVNRVPFIAFRSLSDLAGGGEGQNEAAVFFRLAAQNSAAVVIEYLNEEAGRPEGAAAQKE
jgi:adenosylhomocysteine nucleosidase